MARRRHGRIIEVSVSDVISKMPEVKRFDEDEADRNYDLFITTLGFEDRALAITNKFTNKNFKSKLVIVGEYNINCEDNVKNEECLKLNLYKISQDIVYVNANEPSEIKLELDAKIGEMKSSKEKISIAFDISSASSQFIISVLNSIINSNASISLDVYYTEPDDYFPQRAEYFKDRSLCIKNALDNGEKDPLHEIGVGGVFGNALFPGLFSESGHNFVIAIPSYRMERLGRCLQQIDDQILTDPLNTSFWILGDPPKPVYKWRSGFQREVVQEYIKKFSNSGDISSINSVQCCTLDYRETIRIMIEKIDEKIGSRITVVPMGSKMQTVGVALALAVRAECSVIHAYPSAFNPNRYSHGIGDIWVINFQDLTSTKSYLESIGQLNFEPNEN